MNDIGMSLMAWVVRFLYLGHTVSEQSGRKNNPFSFLDSRESCSVLVDEIELEADELGCLLGVS